MTCINHRAARRLSVAIFLASLSTPAWADAALTCPAELVRRDWGGLRLDNGEVILRIRSDFTGVIAIYDPDAGGQMTYAKLVEVEGIPFLAQPDLTSSTGRIFGRAGAEKRGPWFPADNLMVRGSRIKDQQAFEFVLTTMIWTSWGEHDLSLSQFSAPQNYDGRLVIVGHVTKRNEAGLPETVVRRWAIAPLADCPMTSRPYDPAFGFFPEDTGRNGAPEKGRANIMRWRLEPDGGVGRRPSRPIIFYLDPAIPPSLVKWVKQGVEEWQGPLATAGFDGAILVQDLPADADWLAFSAAHNVVRWRDWTNRGPAVSTQTDAAANGPTWVDLRTGEIVRAEILLGRAVQYVSDQFFVRCGALVDGLEPGNFPEELIGRLIQSVTAHETGHILGLADGNYGKRARTIEQLRDARWLASNSFTPSVLNYTRCNSIAQPSDGISLDDLVQKVGIADHYQIAWGYGASGEAATLVSRLPGDRASALQSVSFRPYYPNLGAGTTLDANDNVEVVDGARLSLANLERAMRILDHHWKATGGSASLALTYSYAFSYWSKLMIHAAAPIGGVDVRYSTDGIPTITTVSPRLQRESLEFVRDRLMSADLIQAPPDAELERFGVEVSGETGATPDFLNALLNPEQIYRILIQKRRNREQLGLDEYLDVIFAALFAPDVPLSDERMALQLRAVAMLAKTALAAEGNAQPVAVAAAPQLAVWLEQFETRLRKIRSTAKDEGKAHIDLVLATLERSER